MGRWAAPAACLLSSAIHAALFALATAVPVPSTRVETVAVQIIEAPRPSPPPAEPEPVHELRRRSAVAPPQAKPTRQPPAPPPPNAPPPAQALPSAPVRIGISMSSTTEAGTAATATGNTLYGRTPEHAADPSAVQPYGADRYAPPAELTALPEPISCEVPKSEYPEEARRIGFEGKVRLRLRIDEAGLVTAATVIEDPGHGLGLAAGRSIPRWCRFRAARRKGEAVATEIPFTVRFELP